VSEHGEIDGDLYRKVLGRYPTGVTLVTGLDGTGDTDGGSGAPLAMVIGSFVSVSMDPPLVGFLPGKSSYTWPRIEASGSFCVNVLSDEQAELSNGFFRKDGDPWEGTGWVPAASGSPLIPSCLASIDCSIHEVVDAGDHVFVMGRVEQVTSVEEGSPLVFLGGAYGRFGQDG